MTLKTEPIFYYGFEVTSDYTWIDFREGELGSELSVSLDVGVYNLEEIRSLIENALNETGTLNYTVSVDRSTRKLSIMSGEYFELLLGTGSHSDKSALKCFGFSNYPVWGEKHLYGEPDLFYGDTDTGLFPVHSAKFKAGFSFDPQFCAQDFRDADNNSALRSPSVNESVDGSCVEVISFGEDRFYDFNFRYITNLAMPCGGPIRNDPNALDNVNAFMGWAIKRKVIEYIPDKRNPNIFYKIRLEKSRGSSKGTGYSLKELYSRGLPDFYETGILTFRRLD